MKASVYLVDDHAVVRQGLRALLEQAGHPVLGDSGDFTQSLSDVQRLEPDVVLLDLNLGDRSGLELLAELGRRKCKARCLMLTMSTQPQHVSQALQLGAIGYVLKGSPSDDLLSALQSAAQSQRHLSPAVADLALQALVSGPGDDPFAQLSMRERQVVQMVVNGRSSAAIAEILHVSPKTVDSYRSRLMAKLGAADITALVKLAMRHGLVSEDER